MPSETVDIILRWTNQGSPGQGTDLPKVQDQVKATRLSIADLWAGFELLKTGLTSLGQAVFGTLNYFAALHDQLGDVAGRTGLATETLSGLRAMAMAAGDDFGSMEPALVAFVDKMSAAAAGSEQAAGVFAALGVSVTDASGKLRTTDEVLRETADAINAISDPTQRAAAAVEAFGSRGSHLINTLAGGSAQLDAFAEFAREFGMDTGPAAAKAAEDWQRALADLQLVAEGAGSRLVQSFGFDTAGEIVDIFSGMVVYLSTLLQGLVDAIVAQMERGSRARELLLAGDVGGAAAALKSMVTDPWSDAADTIQKATAATEAYFAALDKRNAIQGAATGGGGRTFTPTSTGKDEEEFELKSSVGQIEFHDSLELQIIEARERLRLRQEETARLEHDMLNEAATEWKAIHEELQRDWQDVVDEVVAATARGITGGPESGLDALSSAGPWGQLVAAIVELVANFDSLISGFDEFHNNLIASIEKFPETLGKNMDKIFNDSLITAVPGFIESLADNLDVIIQGLIEGVVSSSFSLVGALIEMFIQGMPRLVTEFITMLFSREFWEEVGRGIKEAVSGAFSDIEVFGGEAEGKAFRGEASVGRVVAGVLTGGISEAVRGFDLGGHVDRTGLAMVHAGEIISRRQDVSAGWAGGGGGLTVNFGSGMVMGTPEQLARELARHLGASARNVQWPG